MTGFKDRFLAHYNGLKVRWFDGWHPILDDAIHVLPEMETCPHELFRSLIQNPGSIPKKIALVTKYDLPVAMVPLRQLGRRYYEVATWMIPGAVFPAKSGYLVPALESLGVEVWVSWRRMETPSPQSLLTRHLKKTPVHVLDCTGDIESYWHESGYYKTIRTKRDRCKSFEVTENSAGSAEWTIRNAADKWRDNPTSSNRATEDWAISDLMVAVKYWESQGKHYTLLLLDKGNPIGGTTILVHNKDMVGMMIYRKPGYEWHGIGVRLLDLSASFAAKHGFRSFDFGGGAEYKENWAPQAGELWLFSICPEPLFRTKQALNWLRGITNR